MHQRQFKSYLQFVAILVALTLIAIFTINVYVDPQDFKGALGLTAARRANFTEQQQAVGWAPDSAGNRRAKSFNIGWQSPDVVIFGSSVVFGSIDPSHPVFRKLGSERSFNYGVAGATIEEVASFFEHAQVLRPMKTAIIALDFFMFNGRKPPAREFAEIPFAQDPFYRVKLARYLGERLLSYEYLYASLAAAGLDPKAFLKRWQINTALALEDAQMTFRANPTFEERLLAVERTMISALYPGGGTAFSFMNEEGQSSFESLRHIISLARANGTDLLLFVPPSHARTWEIIRHIGLWDKFETWLRELTAIVAEDARAYSHKKPVALWDFCCYNSITSEPLPDQASGRDSFVGYYDSMHFKNEVGNMVLDRVFSLEFSDPKLPADFGIRLLPENIDERLITISIAREQYIGKHVDEITALAALTASVHKLRH